MRLLAIYRLLPVLVVALGPRYHVTALDCDWRCILTLGFSRCCKSDCCSGPNDYNDEVISVEKKGPESLDKSQHPTELKISTEGGTDENDTSKYKVYKRDGTDTYLYKFNDQVKCTAIKCNDKEVWKRESDTESPDSFTYNKTDNSFTLWFGLEYIKFTLDTSSGTWKGTDRESIIKITTEGSDRENDKSKYDTSNPDANTYEFKFKDGAKCTKVTHLDKDVWKYGTTTTSTTGGTTGGSDGTTPTSGGTPQYPKSIQYNKKDNVYTIEFESGSSTYRLNGDKWEESAGSVLDVATAKDDDKDSRFTKSQVGQWQQYAINSDVKIIEVKCDGKTVWKQDTNNTDDYYKGHPTMVKYIASPPMIDIIVNNKIKSFSLVGSEWK